MKLRELLKLSPEEVDKLPLLIDRMMYYTHKYEETFQKIKQLIVQKDGTTG